MRSVGIRELRQRGSPPPRGSCRRARPWRSRIAAARLRCSARSPHISPYERLRSVGEVSEADGSIDDLPEPIEPVPGMPLPSGDLGPDAER